MPRNTLPICARAISHGSSMRATPRTISEHREHADHDGNEREAAGELGVAEWEARESRRVVEPDAGDEQAEQQRDHALQRVGKRDEHRAKEAQHHQPEILERGEPERDLGERGRGENEHRGAEQAADHREDEAGAKRGSPWPLRVIAYASSV